MGRLETFSALALPFLAGSSGLPAQDEGGLPPGGRVRVTAPRLSPKPLVGIVESSSAQAVLVRVGERDPAVSVPRADIMRLELSRGRARRKSALIGGAIGAVVCLGGVYALCKSEGECDPVVAAATSAGFGFGVGAGVGALVAPERWQDVPLDRVRVSLAPTRGGGVSIRASFAFP